MHAWQIYALKSVILSRRNTSANNTYPLWKWITVVNKRLHNTHSATDPILESFETRAIHKRKRIGVKLQMGLDSIKLVSAHLI